MTLPSISPADYIQIGIGMVALLYAARGNRNGMSVDFVDCDAAIEAHQRQLIAWLTQATNPILGISLSRDEHLVDLELEAVDQSGPDLFAQDRLPVAIDLAALGEGNCIIVGDLGAGKSTTLRFAADTVASNRLAGALPVPIFLELRSLSHPNSIIHSLQDCFGLTVGVPVGTSQTVADRKTTEAVMSCLERLYAVVFLDGLDELPLASRRKIITELRSLAQQTRNARFVVSSRPGAYLPIQGFRSYRLKPLSDAQIRDAVESIVDDVDKRANLLAQLNQQHARLGGVPMHARPLWLHQQIAVYIDKGKVEESEVKLLGSFVSLCIKRWDAMKEFLRENDCKMNTDEVLTSQSALAYRSAMSGRHGRVIAPDFTGEGLDDLPRAQLQEDAIRERVFDGLVTDTSLLVRVSGHEYSFSHRGLFEYLAAYFLVENGRDPNAGRVLAGYPNVAAYVVCLKHDGFSFVSSRLYTGARRAIALFLPQFLESLGRLKFEFSGDAATGAPLLALLSCASEMNESEQFELNLTLRSAKVSDLLANPTVMNGIAGAVRGRLKSRDNGLLSARLRREDTPGFDEIAPEIFLRRDVLFAFLNKDEVEGWIDE